LSSDTIGILISDVEPKSKAEKAGFEAGDVIIQIEDVEIKNFANLENAIKKYENKNKRVYVNRYGQTILFIIQ
ncbi:PDZ domain-containing protein, partial [Aliarcobacter butzleri]|nr:PDZ domain-containing protein [Aliarcobacter butzleri]